MNLRLLDFLADPNDGGALELHTFEGSDDQIRTGVLRNPQTGRWYPIRDGIPTMFADGLREGDDSFVARYRDAMSAAGCDIEAFAKAGAEQDFDRIESERRARDEQAEDYDRILWLKLYEHIEIPAYLRALKATGPTSLQQRPLLEAGCGTGRCTGLFAELASEVVAMDMSRASILRNRVRHAGKTASPVHYVHADLTHLPLKDKAFGRIAHCAVYEHIPSRALRQRFLQHAQRTLHDDGVLLLSTYRYGGITRYFAKEGEHAGGIPFTRLTEEELRAETEPFFHITTFRASLGVYMTMLIANPRPYTSAAC